MALPQLSDALVGRMSALTLYPSVQFPDKVITSGDKAMTQCPMFFLLIAVAGIRTYSQLILSILAKK